MTLGVGIIGFGVMGKTHAAAYQAARAAGLPVELIGACVLSSNPSAGGRSGGNLGELASSRDVPGVGPVPIFASHHDLLADQRIHAVSITTWTESHVSLALEALAAGKHVLVEKPVALTTTEVARLAAEVPRGRVCMPAFCMRYWPGWPWLRDRIQDASLGRLLTLRLSRLGEQPDWARAFYGDPARSGGALFDLHIHDVDFVRWCLGEPDDLSSQGTLSHVTTTYRYAGGPHEVVAEGGHLAEPGFGFHMRYHAVFERAEADFYHSRAEPVLVTTNGTTTAVSLPAGTAYELQARHFVEQCLGRSTDPPRATMADAVAVTRLLEREARMVGVGSR